MYVKYDRVTFWTSSSNPCGRDIFHDICTRYLCPRFFELLKPFHSTFVCIIVKSFEAHYTHTNSCLVINKSLCPQQLNYYEMQSIWLPEIGENVLQLSLFSNCPGYISWDEFRNWNLTGIYPCPWITSGTPLLAIT